MIREKWRPSLGHRLQLFGEGGIRFDARLVFPLRFGWAAALTKVTGSVVGADHQDRSDDLSKNCLEGWEECEPHSRPGRHDVDQPRNFRATDPMSELHLLSLLADHDQQHDAKQDA